jgi:hypothetical protein
MAVSRELSPALHVVRMLGVLPFSRLKHRNPPHLRSSSVVPQLLSFATHLMFLTFYLVHIVVTFRSLLMVTKSQESTLHISATVASRFIVQCIDLANKLQALYLVWRTRNVIETIMLLLQHTDHLLNTSLKTKRRTTFIAITFVMKYIIKIILVFVFLYKSKFSLGLSPHFSSAVFVAEEILLLVFCLEARDRLRIVNTRLVNKNPRVTNLALVLQTLYEAQESLRQHFNLFLLLNTSHLFLLALSCSVMLALPCISGYSTPSMYGMIPTNRPQCTTYAMILVDICIRFVIFVWGCSTLTFEVSLFDNKIDVNIEL